MCRWCAQLFLSNASLFHTSCFFEEVVSYYCVHLLLVSKSAILSARLSKHAVPWMQPGRVTPLYRRSTTVEVKYYVNKNIYQPIKLYKFNCKHGKVLKFQNVTVMSGTGAVRTLPGCRTSVHTVPKPYPPLIGPLTLHTVLSEQNGCEHCLHTVWSCSRLFGSYIVRFRGIRWLLVSPYQCLSSISLGWDHKHIISAGC